MDLDEAMVEAAAKAVDSFKGDVFFTSDTYEGEEWGDERDWCRAAARAALAAAFSVGEVRGEWMVATTHRTGGGRYESHYDDRGDLDRTLKRLGRNTDYRLASIEARTVRTFPDGSVLTSPWREVDNEEQREHLHIPAIPDREGR